jgi:putative MATE family efflux protein
MRAAAISFPLMGISATASGAIRGTGDAKTPMLVSVVVSVLNAGLAAVLILWLQMGVLGACIALVASRLTGAVLAVIMMVRKGYLRSVKNLVKIRLLYVKQVLRIGVYAGAENMIFSLGRTLTNAYFVSSGTNHITANGISGSIFAIIMAPGNSMAVVASALVGRYIGAGEKEQAYKTLRNIILFCTLSLVGINLLFVPFMMPFAQLYTHNPDVLRLVRLLVIPNTVFIIFAWPSAFVFFSGMRGAGDVRYATIVSITTMWTVRVLFGYILGYRLGFGVVGVWYAMYFDWCVRSVFAWARFKRKKWLEKRAI